MNKVNFEQTGGFPLETNTLSFLQSAYGQLSGLAGLGGQSYILNGCTVAGGNVTDGTIVIDGEVLPFVGGPKLARVIIDETVTDKTFEDGVSKPVYYTRVAKMAAAGGVTDFDSLKRVSNMLAMSDRIKDQEVVQWTPTIMAGYNVVISGSGETGWMFRQGRLIILHGSFYYKYIGAGTQKSFFIKSLPFTIHNVGTLYGTSYHRDITNNGEIFNKTLYKNSDNSFLTMTCNAPQDVVFSCDFTITLFTV